jgi:hypothetical protein
MRGKAADRDGASASGACCGLFSVAAMLSDMRTEFGIDARVTTILPPLLDPLDGQGAGHIAKPPRA